MRVANGEGLVPTPVRNNLDRGILGLRGSEVGRQGRTRRVVVVHRKDPESSEAVKVAYAARTSIENG